MLKFSQSPLGLAQALCILFFQHEIPEGIPLSQSLSGLGAKIRHSRVSSKYLHPCKAGHRKDRDDTLQRSPVPSDLLIPAGPTYPSEVLQPPVAKAPPPAGESMFQAQKLIRGC